MRMACKRAGPAMPSWLTKQDKAKMLEYYIAAQRLTYLSGGTYKGDRWVPNQRYQVDHIVPIRGCYLDKKTGCNIHYVCGLHVPDNLRVILAKQNRKRADQLYTPHLPEPPDDEIPF